MQDVFCGLLNFAREVDITGRLKGFQSIKYRLGCASVFPKSKSQNAISRRIAKLNKIASIQKLPQRLFTCPVARSLALRGRFPVFALPTNSTS